jgi:hypothetical protein
MFRSCAGSCLMRIAFIIFALVVLAVYISYNGPVM